MAAIDKTYANREQWNLAIKFLRDTREQQIRELGETIQPYYDREFPLGQDECALWNTSTIQDIWLKRNCQLDFVQERLKAQYDTTLDWWAEKCVFDVPGLYFVEIKTDKDCLYFFDTDLDGKPLIYDETDDIIVYGTTRVFEVIDSAIETFSYNFSACELTILYYGCELKYKDGVWTVDGVAVDPWPIRNAEPKLPRIMINPPLSSIRKGSNIVISNDESGIHPISDYHQYSNDPEVIRKNIMHRFYVPNYVKRFIY